MTSKHWLWYKVLPFAFSDPSREKAPLPQSATKSLVYCHGNPPPENPGRCHKERPSLRLVIFNAQEEALEVAKAAEEGVVAATPSRVGWPIWRRCSGGLRRLWKMAKGVTKVSSGLAHSCS